MHADESALLRAVCDNPDDDAPRLIYADWLDDTGNVARVARAEFIRLQIGLARAPLSDRTVAAREQRAWQLLHDHNPAWVEPLGLTTWGARFRRGFLDELGTRFTTITDIFWWFDLQPIRALTCDVLPDVRRALIRAVPLGHLPRIRGDPWQRFQALSASDKIEVMCKAGGELERMARTPVFQRLTQLLFACRA